MNNLLEYPLQKVYNELINFSDLIDIYKNLKNKNLSTENLCFYEKKGADFIETRVGYEKIISDELLLLNNNSSPLEIILISNFENLPTRVLYYVQNKFSAKKTLNSLKLPNSFPQNLGERIFYSFKSYLYNSHLPDSEEFLMQYDLPKGKESQLSFVLKKFIYIYKGEKINSDFFDMLKNKNLNIFQKYIF